MQAPVRRPVIDHPPGPFELAPRGETLILHDGDRRADNSWTWNRGNQLYRSLNPWLYGKERRSEPMTEAEQEAVVARFMEFARAHIGSNVELRD